MKILGYGIYQDHQLGGDILFANGFRANGCIVDTFDFKQQAKSYGSEEADRRLIEQAKTYDLLFIGKGERLSANCLSTIRQQGVKIALWYGDIRPQTPEFLKQLLPMVDFFFMTSAGDTLRNYHKLGVNVLSAYILNPFEPSLVGNTKPSKDLDILFTGTGYKFANDERFEVLNYLKSRNDVSFFGGADKYAGQLSVWSKIKKELSRLSGKRKLRGDDYFNIIQRAKIGIGVNATHSINRYTSDRLTHYTGFGTFFLTHYFPGLYDLYEPDEIVSFKDIGELEKQLRYYLSNTTEREIIAKKAQQRTIELYNAKNISGMVLDIVKTEQSDRFSWIEIIKGG